MRKYEYEKGKLKNMRKFYIQFIGGNSMSELKAQEYKRFEDIKHIRDDGSEYWSARELAHILDYTKWDNFNKVIDRAMIACEHSGHSISDDFPEVRKIVDAGATSKPVKDYELSRYACYLARSITLLKLSHFV